MSTKSSYKNILWTLHFCICFAPLSVGRSEWIKNYNMAKCFSFYILHTRQLSPVLTNLMNLLWLFCLYFCRIWFLIWLGLLAWLSCELVSFFVLALRGQRDKDVMDSLNRVYTQTPNLLCFCSFWNMSKEASIDNYNTGNADIFDWFLSMQAVSCDGQYMACLFSLKKYLVKSPTCPPIEHYKVGWVPTYLWLLSSNH